jgi:hypothetical protein
LANLTHGDRAALDEFHAGGREATQELVAQMELRRGLLLDVGSGIGGPLATLLRSTDAVLTVADEVSQCPFQCPIGQTKRPRWLAATEGVLLYA